MTRIEKIKSTIGLLLLYFIIAGAEGWATLILGC